MRDISYEFTVQCKDTCCIELNQLEFSTMAKFEMALVFLLLLFLVFSFSAKLENEKKFRGSESMQFHLEILVKH